VIAPDPWRARAGQRVDRREPAELAQAMANGKLKGALARAFKGAADDPSDLPERDRSRAAAR
jgi:hypothetical protein